MSAARAAYDYESPPTTSYGDEDSSQDHSPSFRPLSGPGASRQARRLQLRNQKFRGATMPARKPSPDGFSTTKPIAPYGSDSENHSPKSYREHEYGSDRAYGSAVLQEISAASMTRSRRGSHKHNLSGGFERSASGFLYNTSLGSSPPASATVRISPSKARTRMAQKTNRAVSEEATAYIEHLEAELATAQNQLASLDSESTAREHAARMRSVTNENRSLQEQITEWETQYEARVHDAVSAHTETETGLKAHIRALEKNKEESAYRIAELEEQLTSALRGLQAVETANVSLERRVEIMSSLLAASPTRLDFRSDSPERSGRARPFSMVHGFSSNGSSHSSPRRETRTLPASPTLSFGSSSPNDPSISPRTKSVKPVSPTETEHTLAPSDMSSDAASVFSDAPISMVDSMTSMDVSEPGPHAGPSLPQASWSAKCKIGRRMRRFGGGSGGPKPLILPSTNHCDPHAFSAPVHELHSLSPPFAFPQPQPPSCMEGQDPEPSDRRPRASSNMDGGQTLRPMRNTYVRGQDIVFRADEDSTSYRPSSAESNTTNASHPSLATPGPLNLMQELADMDSSDAATHSERSASVSEGSVRLAEVASLRCPTPRRDLSPASSPPIERAIAHRAEPAMQHQPKTCSCLPGPMSAHEYMRRAFGEIWLSPVSAARYLIHESQTRVGVPRALLDIQWWLVGVLLGPMAKRRLLCQPPPGSSDASGWRLLDAYVPVGEGFGADALAYGTLYHTPPGTPSKPSSEAAALREAKGGHRSLHAEQTHRQHRQAQDYSSCSPWIWLKFSITLALAVGIAFKDGPGSLLVATECACSSASARERSTWSATGLRRRNKRVVELDGDGDG